MAKRYLGIDIQHEGLAWITVRSGLRQIDIEASGWLPFPQDTDPDTGLAPALAALKATVDPSRLACLVMLPDDHIISRTTLAPFRDPKKLRQILPLDLEPTLPMPVEDLVFDFQLTDQTIAATVLAVAINRARRDFYLATLREAGFDPEVITFQGLPAAHLLTRHLENDTPLALVDGNREHCSIFLIIGRRLTHIRNWSIPPAADHPPEATLAEGIRHTMAALSSRTETPLAVKAVYLTARASEAYDVHRLAEDVATPVSIMAPVDASPVKLTGARPDERFEGVLALCLYAPQAETGLNFYRTAFPLKKMVQQNKAHFVRTAIFGSLLAGLFLAHVAMDIRHSRAQLTALDQTSRELLTATFPTTRNVVDPLQQMIVNLRESRNKASFLAGGDAGPLKIDLLNALSRALPARLDIRLSQLVAGEDQLQLSGTTNTFDAVNQTKSYLEKQALFQKLTIVSANMDPTTERVRFKLTADYLRP